MWENAAKRRKVKLPHLADKVFPGASTCQTYGLQNVLN